MKNIILAAVLVVMALPAMGQYVLLEGDVMFYPDLLGRPDICWKYTAATDTVIRCPVIKSEKPISCWKYVMGDDATMVMEEEVMTLYEEAKKLFSYRHAGENMHSRQVKALADAVEIRLLALEELHGPDDIPHCLQGKVEYPKT